MAGLRKKYDVNPFLHLACIEDRIKKREGNRYVNTIFSLSPISFKLFFVLLSRRSGDMVLFSWRQEHSLISKSRHYTYVAVVELVESKLILPFRHGRFWINNFAAEAFLELANKENKEKRKG